MKSAARRGSPLQRGARWRFLRAHPGSKVKRRKLHWNRWGVAALPRTSARRQALKEQTDEG